jgi:hypothetical protein
MGTGPFKFANFDSAQRVVDLEAFELLRRPGAHQTCACA